MKRAVSFVLIFLVFILIYQIVVIYFEDSYEVKYEVVSGEKNFSIDEIYKKSSSQDGYFLTITSDDNREYVFYTDNYYNKQKKIIKEISYYEKDDYLCISPVTSKNSLEILCHDGENLYSYYYVDEKIGISEFIDELSLSDLYVENLDSVIKDGDVVFYQDNLYDNEYLEIYRYKYLSILNRKELNNISFSSTDIYSNQLGVYIDNYFLLPVLNSNNYYSINCKDRTYNIINFSKALSSNIYIIGVLDKNLYFFDIDNKVEYKVYTNGNYEIIGNVEQGFKMYEDGEWINTSVTEFVNNKVTFVQSIDVDLKYEYDEIYETNNAYYIIQNGNIYKIYKNDLEKRILLLNVKGSSNIQIDNDRIYYLDGEYLYRYDMYGVKKLVKNNEFKYNSINIYHVYND